VVAAVVVAAVLIPSVANVSQVRGGPTHSRPVLASAVPADVTFPVGWYPFSITFDPVNGDLYVDNFGSSNISVVNTTTNKVVAWIPMPPDVEQVVADTKTGVVYAGAPGYGAAVYGIDPSSNRVVWTIPIGCPQGCVADAQAYDPASDEIFVTNLDIGTVTVIHMATIVARIPVGSGGPNGAAYDTANGDVYVSNEGSCLSCLNLTVINGTTNRVVGQVLGSGGGPGVAYDSLNEDIYTCTNGDSYNVSNLVSVANGTTNTLVTSIPIDSGCEAAVYDPVNDYVYITDRYRLGVDLSNVTVVDPDTNRIVLDLPVQMGPTGIAYDSANHNVYVADSDTNNISILPQIYRLTVHETGLPAGTNWSATVGGTTFSSPTPSITFPETNGTFNFTIGSVLNRSACPSSGKVTVAGGPREQNVTFSSSAGCGSPSGFLGFPGQTGYYVLGGITAVLVAAVVVVVVLTRRKRRAKPSPTTSPPGGSPGQGP
jgi:YVTN family beta-propeller protein